MTRRSQINLRFPDELTLKIDRLGKRFGVNRTDIFKAMAEHITENQLGLMLAGKPSELLEPPELPQVPTAKPAVNLPVLSRPSQRPLVSASKDKVK